MRLQRACTLSYRIVAFAVLLAACLGTSCLGPSVYVFHRFDLLYAPDSSFALPRTAPLDSGSFSLVGPKRWYSDQRGRPDCEGFDVYLIDAMPRNYSSYHQSGAFPPFQYEVYQNRGPSPHIVIAYQYTLPLETRDTSAAKKAAHLAEQAAREKAYEREAERLALLILTHGPPPTTVAASETFRTTSRDESEAHCKAVKRVSR